MQRCVWLPFRFEGTLAIIKGAKLIKALLRGYSFQLRQPLGKERLQLCLVRSAGDLPLFGSSEGLAHVGASAAGAVTGGNARSVYSSR